MKIGVFVAYIAFFLLYILLLSSNLVFGLYLQNITYIPLELGIIFFTLWIVIVNQKLILPKKVVIPFFGYVLFPILVTSINASNYFYHFYYGISFAIKILFILILIELDVKLIKKKNLIRMLFVVLLITLVLSIVHLKIGHGRPGWLWPLNISIQEITILIMILSLVLLSGFKNALIPIILFCLLLSVRSSGKTSLLLILISPILFFLCLKFKSFRVILNKYPIFYCSFGLIIVYYIVFNYTEDIIYSYDTLQSIIVVERGDFWKRHSLIVEALYHQTDTLNLLIGSGLGFPNYLAKVNSYLENTPQLFILTLMVYGGLVYTISYFMIINHIKNRLLLIAPDIRTNSLVYIVFFVFITYFTTHEYFNNPFFFSSLAIFITSLKVISNEEH